MALLQLEDIIEKLAPVQHPISGLQSVPVLPLKRKFDTKEIPTSLAPLFGEEDISKFYYMEVPSNKKSILYSLLYIIDTQFKLLSKAESEKYVTRVRQTMSADIDAEKLCKRFNYQKDRSMKKSVLQRCLLTPNTDLDATDCFKKFMVDYFSINLFVFELDLSHSFTKVTHHLSTDDTLESTPYKPTIFMLKVMNTYYPVLRTDDIIWSFYPESPILERLFHQYSDLVDNNITSVKKDIEAAGKAVHLKLSKRLTRNQLQNLAMEYGVNIKKRSKQTGNMIFKNKEELREDLLAICTPES